MRSTCTKILVLGAILAVVTAGCAQQDEQAQEPPPPPEEQSLQIADPPSTVQGNVVSMQATVSGIEIVKADGDTSGDSGHFHVFIDRDPVAVGEVIPKEPGIVHSTDNPINVYGLGVGDHTLTVVIGDGTHERFGEDLEESVTVKVEGPTVDGSSVATVKEGADLTVELKSEGVEIVKADGDTSGDTGHYHVIVDPTAAPKAGDIIAAPEENKIIHTTEASATVAGLTKGEHTIWVVLGDGTHKAFDPPVMDKLTVAVE